MINGLSHSHEAYRGGLEGERVFCEERVLKTAEGTHGPGGGPAVWPCLVSTALNTVPR